MLINGCHNIFSVKGCYQDLWYLRFPNDFNDELLKAVQRYGSHQCQKKNVFSMRLLRDRLPNQLDCEDSLWTFLDAIPQTFDPGQMFAVPLTDAVVETSQHPTFSFNIPNFCIVIFDPVGDECWFRSLAAISGNCCHTFSPLLLPMDRGNFGVFSFLSLALDLSDINSILSLQWRLLHREQNEDII